MFHVEQEADRSAPAPPQVAERVFGPLLPLAGRYAELLAGPGVVRGVIGPDESSRLWERHLLNSAVVAELVPRGCRVLDVGSGAGLPGIPLAVARPDLTVTLLDPMARRARWLQEVVDELQLPIEVHRGRAEDCGCPREGPGWDVVVARAVAPLGRLAGWCLPLLARYGRLLALKGRSASEELERDGQAVRRAGGADMEVVQCGVGTVEPPTTVVVIRQQYGPSPT